MEFTDDTAKKITGDTLPPNLLKVIENIAEEEGYLSYNIEAKLWSSNGGSFIGILHEVNVKGRTSQGEKETNIFVKSITPDESVSIYSIPRSYEKEAYAYNELNNIFSELQEKYNVPTKDRYNTAKGYGKSNTEFIIMQNLAKRGFITTNRMYVTTFKFAEKSLQQLAKFHALSFVIQEKNPSYFDEKIKSLEQPFYYNSDAFNSFVENVSMLATTCLDDEAKEKMKKFIPESFEKYSYYSEDTKSVRCLCHGDYRPNNIMMKLEGEEITELIPVDFQLLFYGCPIIDFLYFIFSATDQQFRKDHLEDLKDIYHNTLKRFLEYFNMDVNNYYPRKEFERIYKERLDYGLMFTFWCIPITMADDGDIPDVTHTSLDDITFNMNDTVKSRLRGIVDDFIRWGYI